MKFRRIHLFIGIGIIIFAIILRAVWVLSATGFFSIPHVSNYAFKYPAPIRMVDPSTISLSTYLSEQLSHALIGRLQKGRGLLQDRSFSLSLPEELLTMGLREKIRSDHWQDMIDTSKAQMAIRKENEAELFLPVFYRGHESPIRLWLNFSTTQDGKLLVELTDFWIGSWLTPSWVSKMAQKEYVDPAVFDLNEKLGQFMKLSKIDSQEKLLLISGELVLQIESFFRK